jgi:hypothetical protein
MGRLKLAFDDAHGLSVSSLSGLEIGLSAIGAPALEGFSPTPEMPEIAEAQALLMAIEAGVHVRHK